MPVGAQPLAPARGTSARLRRPSTGTGSRRRGRCASPAEYHRRRLCPRPCRRSEAGAASMARGRPWWSQLPRALADGERVPRARPGAAGATSLGRGDSPGCPVRTPAGIVAPTLHCCHDMFTVRRGLLLARTTSRRRRADGRGHRLENRRQRVNVLTRDPGFAAALRPVPRNVERLLEQPGRVRGPLRAEAAVAAARRPGRASASCTPGVTAASASPPGSTIEVPASASARCSAALESPLRIDALMIASVGTVLEIPARRRARLLRPRGPRVPETARRPPASRRPGAALRNGTLVLAQPACR